MMVKGFVRSVRIKFLLIENGLTDGFIWCADCHVVEHIDSKTLKRIYYSPSEDEDD